MRPSGVLLLAVAAACVAAVHPMPAEVLPQSAAEASESAAQSSGWGLVSLDALAQRFNTWVAPVVRAIEDAVQNKTVSEVAVEARNATVQLATRVSESETVQDAKGVISPLTEFFDRVHDHVKDRTLKELAGDVQQQIQMLDRSVAQFIRGFGQDHQQAEQAAPETLPETLPEPDKSAQQQQQQDALEQAVAADNELEP